MPRNKIVGKNKRPKSNKATGRVYGKADLASNRRNQKKRVETNREARKRGLVGKLSKMGKDLHHTPSGKLVLRDKGKNRGDKSFLKKTLKKVKRKRSKS